MTERNTAVLYEYAGCETCRKARRWLDAHGVSYRTVPIVERPPSETELERLIAASGISVRKWLNVSGQSYRALVDELGREAVAMLSERELTRRLAADGKLIKRPVLVAKGQVLVGFKEAAYQALFE